MTFASSPCRLYELTDQGRPHRAGFAMERRKPRDPAFSKPLQDRSSAASERRCVGAQSCSLAGETLTWPHTRAPKLFKLDESAGLKSPIVGVSNRNKAPEGPLRSRSPWHEGAYRSDAVLEVHLRTHQKGATENALPPRRQTAAWTEHIQDKPSPPAQSRPRSKENGILPYFEDPLSSKWHAQR